MDVLNRLGVEILHGVTPIPFTLTVWIAFLALIAVAVALDLGVFHRKARVVSLAEALGWSAVWFSLAIAFIAVVFYLYELNPSGWDMDTEQLSGQEAAIQFFTGYLVEKSLSIDNIFVIAMIFTYFRIPLVEQHRVLFWGIMGAVVLRGLMIFGGLALLEQFSWMTYVLGAMLIYSAAKLLIIRDDNVDIANSLTIRSVKKIMPVTDDLHGGRFFVDISGVRTATPLFIALVLVELSDVMFAVDSIPAIFAITRDPFLVFTSNIFAILGLRSLYFVLAGLMGKFRYLKSSLAFLLAYIGAKMLLVHHYDIPSMVSLAMIGGILSVGILASTAAGRDAFALLSPLADDLGQLDLKTYRQARRALFLLLISSVILVGLAVLFLPGPAMLLIPLGLALLAAVVLWAGRWLAGFRRKLDEKTTGKS